MPPNNPLKLAKEALDKAIETKKNNDSLISSIGPAVVGMMQPFLDEIRGIFTSNAEETRRAISNIRIEPPTIPTIQIPEIKIPEINVPAPQVTVNVPEIATPIIPEIKIPEIKIPKIVVPKPEVTVNIPEPKPLVWPDSEMPIKGWVQLMGVDLNNPLPVQLRDAKGRPVSLDVTNILGGGGGGKSDFFTIKGFSQSAYADYINADGRFRVSVETGGSGLTDNELRASSVPVEQVSGSVWSVNVASGSTAGTQYNDGATPDQSGGTGTMVMLYDGASAQSWSGTTGGIGNVSIVDAFGSTAVGSVFNADNRLRVSLETGGSGLTDSELRATAVPVIQVSGAAWSVSVNDVFGSVGTNVVNPDGRLKVELPTGASGLTDTELRATAVPVTQVSGASWSTNVLGTVTVDGSAVTQPVSATNLDIRDLVNASDSVSIYQVSGHRWSTEATQSGTWTVSVSDVFGSVGTNVINPDGRLKVELPTGASGLTDTELRASAVPVIQVSGASWSVYAQDALTTITATTLVNADNRLRVSLETGGSGLTDSELRASAVPVTQVSGAGWSTTVTDIFGSTITTGVLNGDNRIRVSLETGGSGLTDSELRASAVPVIQLTGSADSVYVLNPVSQGDAATALRVVVAGNSDVSVTATQTGTWNIGTVTTVTGVTNSVSAALVDSSGVQYSGSNPVPTAIISGSLSTSAAVLTRQTNPTAVAADYVPIAADDLGRQLIRPVQVRDLVITAYVTLSTGTETTLLAASAGSFHDLIYVMAANTSGAAQQVDIRPVTAGNIVMSLYVPANSTAGVALPVPFPQSASDTGNNWTVDMGDVTNSNILISALFTREV